VFAALVSALCVASVKHPSDEQEIVAKWAAK